MSEWQEVKLGDLCEIFDGPHATPPKTEKGNIFLGISSLGFDGRIEPAHFEYVDDFHFAKWTRRVEPRPEDIVFSYETKLGVAAKIPTGFKCCLGRRMGLLRPNNKIDPEFLLWYYLSKEFQNVIHERTYHGSTVDRIPLKDLPGFPVRLPSISEQRAIASVLTSLDDKIDLLHRQNKTLEAMAETLFRQWFVEEASDDWEVGTLAEVAANPRQPARISEILPDEKYIGLEHVGKRCIALQDHGLGIDVTSNKSAFRANDILFGKLRPYFHKVCYAPFNGICSTDILVIRPKRTELFPFCLFAFFQDDVVEYANSGSAGTRMPRTSWQSLSDYEMRIPDDARIVAFNDRILSFLGKITANLRSIETLENLRDTLLPKLMSGEIRVAAG